MKMKMRNNKQLKKKKDLNTPQINGPSTASMIQNRDHPHNPTQTPCDSIPLPPIRISVGASGTRIMKRSKFTKSHMQRKWKYFLLRTLNNVTIDRSIITRGSKMG